MDFLHHLPKCELHLHIEGTLEPELLLKLKDRNQISAELTSIEDLKQSCNFKNLQSFLDVYSKATSVLLFEQDFYDLTWAYLEQCVKNNIKHTEVFFDIQTHNLRGVSCHTVIEGITRALDEGQRKLNISSYLILCFIRDLDEDSALESLDRVKPYLSKIKGVGLASAELNNPPSKFKRVFAKAKSMGLRRVAHAGEEGGPDYIWDAIHNLEIERIDHGVQAIHDEVLIEYLKIHQIPLTICPLSNIKLKVFKSLEEHPLKKLLDRGVCVTINSDDPAYFGGYLETNIRDSAKALHFGNDDIVRVIENGFRSSFLSESEKNKFLTEIRDAYKATTSPIRST